MVDLTESEPVKALRLEVRTWLTKHLEGRTFISGDTPEGFREVVAWERDLHAVGLSVVHWPREYGGRGLGWWEWLAVESEYFRAGAPPRVTQNGITLLAPALFAHGTDEQRRRYLPPMAAAQELWCQGWSEPEAGSDLASVRSIARQVEGGWLLSGQKTWSTRAAFCSHLFGLFRSEPGSLRHHGLTYFLVSLDSPGIEIRGFRRLDGDLGFADVFFDDVFVPDRDVLGLPGHGWTVAMSTASSERGIGLRSPARFSVAADDLVGYAIDAEAPPACSERAVLAWIHARAYEHYTANQVSRTLDGHVHPAESSVNKLLWSELDLEIHEAALAVAGSPDAAPARWQRGFQFALAGPIYAGTNEIQRTIVAQRLMGLPRDKR